MTGIKDDFAPSQPGYSSGDPGRATPPARAPAVTQAGGRRAAAPACQAGTPRPAAGVGPAEIRFRARGPGRDSPAARVIHDTPATRRQAQAAAGRCAAGPGPARWQSPSLRLTLPDSDSESWHGGPRRSRRRFSRGT